MIYFWTGLAGGLGAALRLFVGRSVLALGWASWPLATFSVNLVGSFLIGFLIIMFNLKYPDAEDLKIALTTGLLGGFTTFSAFSFETLHFFERGEIAKPIIYVLLTVVLCLLACWAGAWFAKTVFKESLVSL